MEFVLSDHAKERMIQRDVPNPKKVSLKLVKKKAKRLVVAQCRKMGYRNDYVYFRSNERVADDRSVYVCKVLGLSKYLVVTVFKLNYTENSNN